nr:Holliday junction branch migration protein RuvA [Desulfobulbaceae bacterium]
MIACLTGSLLHKTPERIIVDCGGVGYDVAFCQSGLRHLPEIGGEVFVFIYTKVREDAIELFGFISREEKELFVVLLGVSGVGPKVALGIVGALSPADFSRAVLTDDLHRLTKLPGIGKKTAERLCLELKDKIQAFVNPDDSTHGEQAGSDVDDQVASDVISALVNLGYPQSQARQALRNVLKSVPHAEPSPPIEELLRLTLRSLA